MTAKVNNFFYKNKRKREARELIAQRKWTDLLLSVEGTEVFSFPDASAVQSLRAVAARINTNSELGLRFAISADLATMVVMINKERV